MVKKRKIASKTTKTHKKVTPKKTQIMGILNPKRRSGVAFMTFVVTTLLCIGIYGGVETIKIANVSNNNVLGLTTAQKKAAIISKAKSFAKAEKLANNTTYSLTPKQEYVNASPSDYTDCSVFVYEVMSHAHADDKADGKTSNFPKSGANAQRLYVRDAKYSSTDGVSSSLYGSKKYIELSGIYKSGSTFYAKYKDGRTAKTALAAGDLMFIPNQHAMIFTGILTASTTSYQGIDASSGQRVPGWTNMDYWDTTYSSLVAYRVR